MNAPRVGRPTSPAPPAPPNTAIVPGQPGLLAGRGWMEDHARLRRHPRDVAGLLVFQQAAGGQPDRVGVEAAGVSLDPMNVQVMMGR
jgi:hypothetical protein